jgi:hypothetical protein
MTPCPSRTEDNDHSALHDLRVAAPHRPKKSFVDTP